MKRELSHCCSSSLSNGKNVFFSRPRLFLKYKTASVWTCGDACNLQGARSFLNLSLTSFALDETWPCTALTWIKQNLFFMISSIKLQPNYNNHSWILMWNLQFSTSVLCKPLLPFFRINHFVAFAKNFPPCRLILFFCILQVCLCSMTSFNFLLFCCLHLFCKAKISWGGCFL